MHAKENSYNDRYLHLRRTII